MKFFSEIFYYLRAILGYGYCIVVWMARLQYVCVYLYLCNVLSYSFDFALFMSYFELFIAFAFILWESDMFRFS